MNNHKKKIIVVLTKIDLVSQSLVKKWINYLRIKFPQIEEFVKRKNAYFILKNTHELKTKEPELEIEVKDIENIEEEAIKIYSEKNPSDFNELIPQLINSLSIEKQEGEKSENFTNRVIEEAKKILKF